jgi:lysozyme
MKTSQKAGAGSLAVIAAATTILTVWEGTDLVAKKDMIGTGNPITFCHGQTDEFGKVAVGTRFTPEQCKDMLAKSLPKYLEPLQKCVTRELPVKTMAALLDAAYNAGPAAVCRSPMVKKMNAGDIHGGCLAFEGWYITTKNNGVRKVIPGLVNRRGGNPKEARKTEKQLCLEGWVEGVEKRKAPTFLEKIKLLFNRFLGLFK